MDLPNQVYPKATTSAPSAMPLYIPDPSIKGQSFDQLLQNRGIRMLHHKATPCPNVIRVDDNAHAPDCQFCDNTGFLYYSVDEIWGIFTGNSIEKTFEQHGVWEIGTAVVTLPTQYPDGRQADFNTLDRLEIPDFEVRLWQLLEYEPTTNNIQSLRYPIVKVEYMASTVNDVLKVFQQGIDFNITSDGNIQWVFGRTPNFNPQNGIGDPLTIVYIARPIYLVLQSLRELRITQEYVNGQKIARRLPQQVLVKRDFLVNSAGKIATSTIAQ